MVCLAIAAVLIQEPSIWFQKDLSSRVLRVDGRYFMATPPELVAHLDVSLLSWSQDGRFLFVRGTKPRARGEGWLREVNQPSMSTMICAIWDAATGRLKEIARLPEPFDNTEHHFAGTSGGGIFISQKTNRSSSTIYWVDAIPGNAPRQVGTLEGEYTARLSPTQEFGVLTSFDGKRSLLLFRGEIADAPKLPANSRFTNWDSSGNRLALSIEGAPRSRSVTFLDLQTRTVSTTDVFEVWKPRMDLPVLVRLIGSEEPKRLALEPLLAERVGSPTVIAEGVTYLHMSMSRNAVAFVSNELIFASSILEMTKAEAEKVAAMADMRTTMLNAETIFGLIHELARESEGVLPTAEDVIVKLSGSDGGPELVSSLTLTYKGVASISASTIELGHVTGKTGRAVIYSDGSVKWQKGSR